MTGRSTHRWLLLCTLVFAMILVPFLLFGERIENWTEDFVQSASGQPVWVATVLGSLLAVDILMPIPSSLVSTAAGFLLGLMRGMTVSLVGMIVSCIIGYWLGAKFGRPIADRLVGSDELNRLENMSRRLGDWVIVASRPVPMLAEASVLFAGIGRMSLYRFLLLSTLSNLAISATYAAVGAFSATVNSFLLAFAGSILFPAIAMLATGKTGEQDQEKDQQPPDVSAGMGRTQLRVINSRIRQFFQKHYEFRVIKRHLEKHHVDLTGKVVLDAGCGSGYSSEVILQKFRPEELYAFDIMPGQVELAKQRGLAARIFVGDIADIELPSEKFDAVFTFGVFHHVPEWPTALREVYRVLKPGGVLLGGEIRREKNVGFEWPTFAQGLEETGFHIVENREIYRGYFISFMCVKPDA